jgi:DHA1 family inner membrane transport protein
VAVGLLAFGTFVVGTSELVVTGLLPLMAADLAISVPTAGLLVTFYAAAFALVTPLIALRTSSLPRRPVLLACLGVYVLGSVAAARAEEFAVLLGTRVAVAAAAGVFEAVASATAAGLVLPHRRATAMAMVSVGFSASLVFGVPLGTLLGVAFGWRVAFGALAVLGVLAAGGVAAWLPAAAGVQASDGPRFAGVRRWELARALATTMVAFGGLYVAATYVAPFLGVVAGLSPAEVAGALLVIGVGSIVGNIVGGLATDRWGARSTLTMALVAMGLSLSLARAVGGMPLGLGVVLAGWGLSGGAFVSTQQARVLRLLPRLPDLGPALNLSALNLGIAAGALVGGAVIARGGLADLGLVGAVVVGLGLILHAWPAMGTRSKGNG